MARVVFPGLLAVVVLSPLPFGSTLPWVWSLLSAVLGGLLVLWGIAVASGRLRVAVPLRRVWPAAVAFLAVVGWAAVQAAMPAVDGGGHGIWPAEMDGAALSLNPFDTHTAAMRLLEIESALNEARKTGEAGYSLIRHVDVLIALAGEADYLRGSIPRANTKTAAPADRRSAPAGA